MGDRNAQKWSRWAPLLTFAVLASCSLVLTATTNRTSGMILNLYAPNAAWLATAAVPSAVLIVILYAIFGAQDALRWPRLALAIWQRVFVISAMWFLAWMVGCAIAAALTGHWINYAKGFPFVAAFIVFGPVGEELLFRGLIFERAREIWPTAAGPAICISTAVFSLHHIALGTAPQGIATAQLLFTIPMGLVLALLRERTGSILPGWVLHLATNLPAIF
jgi:membrane protease YdiL (CAAX protease family)